MNAEKMVHAHTNLAVFASVVGILECGAVYGGVGSEKAERAIIALCKKEQARLYKLYEAERYKIYYPKP